jgi:CHAD domain-containing protein
METSVISQPQVQVPVEGPTRSMVVHSKWLADSSPEMPVSEVARSGIKRRLETLWHYLPLAAERPEEDIEHIHQLRVWTRRSDAALEIFENLQPKRSIRWIRQELRRVRKAAGDARDFDVFIERLEAGTDGFDPHILRRITDELRWRRQAAQPAVQGSYAQLKLWQFDLRIDLLAERVRWRGVLPEPDFGTAARQMLRPVVEKFHAARQADFADTEALHQLRICGKCLRYAMELLAGGFPKGFRKELYPTVGLMQDKLGVLNDHATAYDRLSRWMRETDDPEMRAIYGQLADREAAAIETTADEFRNWWTPQWADDFETALRDAVESKPG